ncbi:MAG: hypothetical protein IPO74_12325 [Thermomonas sp.]|jgi:hypothetical protein|nr:hypothetical protein [Thermomonas sp.]
MHVVFLHFIAATITCLLVFVAGNRIAGTQQFSAPFGVVFIGVACAALAHFLSPWATPAIVLLYALSVLGEAIRDRRDLRGRER